MVSVGIVYLCPSFPAGYCLRTSSSLNSTPLTDVKSPDACMAVSDAQFENAW